MYAGTAVNWQVGSSVPCSCSDTRTWMCVSTVDAGSVMCVLKLCVDRPVYGRTENRDKDTNFYKYSYHTYTHCAGLQHSAHSAARWVALILCYQKPNQKSCVSQICDVKLTMETITLPGLTTTHLNIHFTSFTGWNSCYSCVWNTVGWNERSWHVFCSRWVHRHHTGCVQKRAAQLKF